MSNSQRTWLQILDDMAWPNDPDYTDMKSAVESELAKLRAINAELLAALQDAYLVLLQMPHNLLRIKTDPIRARVRDAIANATDGDSERVQNDFETRAAIAKAVQP